MNKLILIALILLVWSCCPKATTITERIIRKDSIVERVRDSIITIPADSAFLKALLECDSLGNVYLKQLHSFVPGTNIKPPSIRLENNLLTVLSSIDSMNIYIRLKDRYEMHIESDKIVETKYINELTKWQVRQIWLGRIFLALLGLASMFVAYKLFKIFNP